jgi:cysteinyl-tRNA synthetase
MGLKLYNSLTRGKDEFEPLDAGNVRIYVCGPTVYDYAHIGNARPIIVFDVLFRLLRHIYGEESVTYVRNITDVDDKINARALEEGVSIKEVTERTTQQFHEDIAELGVLPPTHEPRATAHIDGMIKMIESLIEKGHAYAKDGHALFHVPSMKDYGKLSGRTLDEMEAGARVEVAPYKKDPMDFVLWKPSDETQPGWDSPWGRGRPGWHIECSAMSKALLGEEFDIHGGGIDLIFPHHENEVAQSRCCAGTDKMAQVWMHNGFLQVEGEKMSKSLGNFFTIRDLLGEWPGEVLRLQMLMTHYRQPIDWTKERSEEAKKIWLSWLELGEKHQCDLSGGEVASGVLDALRDDLNTPKAIAELHQLASAAKKGNEGAARDLVSSCVFMGILSQESRGSIAKEDGSSEIAEDMKTYIEDQIAKRIEARGDKNWAESDRIRDELLEKGIVLKDGPEGTTWEEKS